MRFETGQFAGMQPAIAADKLPTGSAQVATNCRLVSGSLEPWKSNLTAAQSVVKTGTIRSILLMDADGSAGGPWLLHDTADLVYKRSPVAANTDDRTYFTGASEPRVTNKSMAVDAPIVGSAGAYPYRWLKLGMPPPVAAPEVTVNVVAPTAGSVTLTNPGAESGLTGWTLGLGDVVQSAVQFHTGLYSWQGGNAAASELYQPIDIQTANLIIGQTMALSWWQKGSVDGASMGLRFYNASAVLIGESFLDNSSPGATWTQKTLAGILIPTGAVTLRVVQRYARTGGSGVTDAFIDDVVLTGATAALSYDGSSLTGWLTSSSGSAAVTVDTGTGWPAPSYKLTSDHNGVVSVYQDAGVSNSPSYSMQFEFYTNGNYEYVGITPVLAADSAGSGKQLFFGRSGIVLQDTGSWTSTSSSSQTIGSGNYRNVRFKATITVTDNQATKTVSITTTRSDTGALIETVSTEVVLSGDYIGFKGWNGDGDSHSGWLDNIQINITPGVPDATGSITYTNYVMIYLNALGDKSKPSPVSRDVQTPGDNSTVTLALETTGVSGWVAVTKNLYRAVTASDGTTVYQLVVDELPLATATYLDTVTDADLEDDILETDGWDVPPANAILLGIGANGIAFFGSGNQVLPAPINHPHAVLTLSALNTDFDIIGGAVIDTDCYVVTQGTPLIVQGTDPTALQPQLLEEGIGGVSGRSIVTMVGIGVVYASARGLEYMNRSGAGLLTQGVVSEKEWAAYNPSTLTAVSYDGLYVGFHSGGGIVFDPKTKSLSTLDFIATALYVHPGTGKLYMVVAGVLVVFNSGAALLTATWQSADQLLQRPVSFDCARVFVSASGSATLRLYYDGTLVHSIVVTSSTEFLLPAYSAADRVSIGLVVTAGAVRAVVLAESMEEL